MAIGRRALRNLFLIVMPCFLSVLQPVICLSPICQPCQIGDCGPVTPTIPSLPDQFVARLEISQKDNLTTEVDEYYDYQRNKAATIIRTLGYRSHNINDYNTKRRTSVYGLDTPTPTCMSMDMEKDPSDVIGMMSKTGHLKHTVDMLNLKSQQVQYRGQAVQRGISCNFWTLCVNTANSSTILSYFFATKEWMMPAGQGSDGLSYGIPVMIGIKSHTAVDNTSYPGVPAVEESLTYINYFGFKSQVPPASAFQIPHGVFCPELKSNRTLPVLSNNYYAGVEYYSPKENVHHVMSVYYDFRHGLVRSYSKQHGADFSYEILDYNQGNIYNIMYTNDGSTVGCTVHGIAAGDRGAKKVGNATQYHFVMKNAMEQLGLSTSVYVYQGDGNVRGRDVEVWVSRHNISKKLGGEMSIVEWSFLKTTREPVQLALYDLADRSVQTIINFYDYRQISTVQFMLNRVKLCYENNMQIIEFSLSNPFPESVPIFTRDHVIKIMVWMHAQVSLVRVSTTQVTVVKDRLRVISTILGPPSVNGTDMTGKRKDEISLAAAVNNVKAAVEGGDFKVSLNGSDARYTAVADKSSFSLGNGVIKTKIVKEGVSGSTIAIIVFVVLILIGGVVFLIFVILRRRGINLFEYQRHSDSSAPRSKDEPSLFI